MIQIKPVSDLRNKFPDIEKIVNAVNLCITHDEVFGELKRRLNG